MEQSGGRPRVLCWELVGLVCFAGGDTSKQGETKGNQGETKGNQGKTKGKPRKNQGKPRETKGKPRKNQGKTKGKPRGIKRSQGDQGDQCEPRETPSINKRNTFQSIGFLSKQG